MQTASEIIDAVGGTAVVARAFNIQMSAVSNWRSEESIPSRRWPKIVAMAKAKRVKGVTLTELARLFGESE